MLRALGSGFDFLKKAFLVVIVFSIILAIFGNVIVKNRPRIDEKALLAAQQKELYKVFDDKRVNSTKMGRISLAIYRFSYCSLIGELCTDKPVSGDSYFKSSLLGRTTSLLTIPFQYPPASGVFWVTNSLQKAGFIPQSYAAEGLGFSSIKPLMNLWTIFRDVTYLIIVVILVAIGFMIMFRMKINPQTVISVENSLPKIVVALLLITFSFAIAGFLIDMMYLLILVSINILSSGDKYYSTVKVQNEFLNSGIGTLFEYILPFKNPVTIGIANSPLQIPLGENVPLARVIYVGDALATFIPDAVNYIVRFIAMAIIPIAAGVQIVNLTKSTGVTSFLNNLSILGNGVGTVPEILLGLPLTAIVYITLSALVINGLGFVIGIIVILTVTAVAFRIFFMLFRAYLQIIIAIIFAPVVLLFEAVPGKSTFSYWIKLLIGELITFPIVITMLLVGKIMIATMSFPGDYWNAPFIGNLNTEGFGVLLGVGLIFITPDIVKFVKDALGIKPLPINIGLGTFLGGAGLAVGGGMSLLGQFSSLNMGLNAFGENGFIGQMRKKGNVKDEEKKTPANLNQGNAIDQQPK